jgi:hypothetical protein
MGNQPTDTRMWALQFSIGVDSCHTNASQRAGARNFLVQSHARSESEHPFNCRLLLVSEPQKRYWQWACKNIHVRCGVR